MAASASTAATASPGTTSPITVSHSGTVGEVYALCLARSTAADMFTGVTDNGGNTWALGDYAPKSGTAGRQVALYVMKVTTAFTSISISFNGTGVAYATLVKLSGVTGVLNAVNAEHRTTGQGTNPPSVDITPDVPDCLGLGFCMANPLTASQISPSSGWASLTTHVNGPAVAWRAGLLDGVAVGIAWTLASASGSGQAIGAFEVEEGEDPVLTVVWTLFDGEEEVPLEVEGVFDGTDVLPAVVDISDWQ